MQVVSAPTQSGFNCLFILGRREPLRAAVEGTCQEAMAHTQGRALPRERILPPLPGQTEAQPKGGFSFRYKSLFFVSIYMFLSAIFINIFLLCYRFSLAEYEHKNKSSQTKNSPYLCKHLTNFPIPLLSTGHV